MRSDKNTEITLTPQALDAWHQALVLIASGNKLPAILKQVAIAAVDVVKADYAALGAYDATGRCEYFAQSGIDPERVRKMAHFPKGVGGLLSLIDPDRPLGVDQQLIPTRGPNLNQEETSVHYISLPISRKDELLGHLYLAREDHGRPFNAAEVQLTSMLAAHATIAIRRVRRHEREAEQQAELAFKNQQLNALNSAAIAVSQNLQLDQVLYQIVESGRKLTGATYGALGVSNGGSEFVTFVHSGLTPEQVAQMGHLPRGRGLLGAVITEHRPIRIPRIGNDPRSVGFPIYHPPMDSFLGVPILGSQGVLGNLYLTNKQGADEFSEEDEAIVVRLAAHAAIAIQNAHLYEQLEELTVSEERSRLGMDLHDGVIQSIYAVGLTLESAQLSLPPEAEEAKQLIHTAIYRLNDAIRDIRNFILDLQPRRFQGDLQAGIQQLTREFQANTLTHIKVELPKGLDRLNNNAAQAIFFTVQEALANIARHAQANKVILSLSWRTEQVVLKIKDNGRGFNVSSNTHRIGHGLQNMQRRAERLGGSFRIDSAPGEGTTIETQLPI